MNILEIMPNAVLRRALTIAGSPVKTNAKTPKRVLIAAVNDMAYNAYSPFAAPKRITRAIGIANALSTRGL